MEDLSVEMIYIDYFQSVYSFCLYSTSSKEEAEDITHDTFIKIMNRLHTLKDPTKVKAWVFSIARTTLIDHQRRKKLKQFISGEKILEMFQSKEQTPEEALLHMSSLQQVKYALSTLQEKQREVFLLRTIHGLSIKEVAEVMRCSEGKVRVDHHRSTKKIQSILAEITKEDEVHYESS